jgi:hypothetical protein
MWIAYGNRLFGIEANHRRAGGLKGRYFADPSELFPVVPVATIEFRSTIPDIFLFCEFYIYPSPLKLSWKKYREIPRFSPIAFQRIFMSSPVRPAFCSAFAERK